MSGTPVTTLSLVPADRPTMYFVGVTTGQSMIMRVFPKWARHLGLGDCVLKGIDLALHDEASRYREVVTFLKEDRLSLGALVTTHKLDLLHASRDLFDDLDDFAGLMGEVSSISKSNGRLCGGAKDPITSGLAVNVFLDPRHWETSKAHAFIMGAGGSSIALCSSLARPDGGRTPPAGIVVSNRSPRRLSEVQEVNRRQDLRVPIKYVLTPRPEDNDAVLRGLPRGSLVVNATGLGKDAPGSPLSDAAEFPHGGIAWDFNYRGDLVFLRQARRQAALRALRVEDGWRYFIYGWLAVIAEVFHREIPLGGAAFEDLCWIAGEERGPAHG
jgi:shikimate 5-dehydrogenase